MANGSQDFVLERRVAVAIACLVVLVVLFLVVRNQPFADPNLVLILRIVLSLAIGILGATIPGFLQVEYSAGGFMIRAAGALALFVITFFGTPKVPALKLSNPRGALDKVSQIDLRSGAAPDKDETSRGKAPVYATVPIAIRSIEEPARRMAVDYTTLLLRFDNTAIPFRWRYFVTMHEERFGVWLGIDSDAHPFTVEPGDVAYHEILHAPTQPTTWNDLLHAFTSAHSLTAEIEMSADNKTVSQSCRVDLPYWQHEVQAFIDRTRQQPGRITMTCVDHSPTGNTGTKRS